MEVFFSRFVVTLSQFYISHLLKFSFHDFTYKLLHPNNDKRNAFLHLSSLYTRQPLGYSLIFWRKGRLV